MLKKETFLRRHEQRGAMRQVHHLFRARDDIYEKAIMAMWTLVGNAEEFKHAKECRETLDLLCEQLHDDTDSYDA